MDLKPLAGVLLIAIGLNSLGFASIDSLWTSPASYGYKGALRDFSTGQAHYFFVLDSAAQRCRIYQSDNFSQAYNFPLICSAAYTYVYPYFLNDANGNGHPEMLVQDYAGSDGRVRIIDMLAGAVAYTWFQAGHSYNVNCLVITPGSNTLKLGLDKRNSSAPYPYTTEFLVYSLGITLMVAEQPTPGPNRSGIQLQQSYPNPSNAAAIIEFNLGRSGHAVLKVFNQVGQEVAVLVDKNLPAGKHVFRWDGVPDASGVYYYQLQTPDGTLTKKLVLLR